LQSQAIPSEEFYFKAVTLISTTPEDLANVLSSEKLRLFWDLRSIAVHKTNEDQLLVTYETPS